MKRFASFRDEFPISRTHIFLNHAGVAPTSLRAAAEVSRFMDSLARSAAPASTTGSRWPPVAGTVSPS